MKKFGKKSLKLSGVEKHLSVSIWLTPKILKRLKKGYNHLAVIAKSSSNMAIDFIGTNHIYYINGKEVK